MDKHVSKSAQEWRETTARRAKESTMMMRVKPVIISNTAGRNESEVSSSSVWMLRL